MLGARKCKAGAGPDLLHKADLELDQLRYTVRLCQEIGLLSQKQYLHVGRLARGDW